jgi:glycosyltransferase involved in cell wall biosynthesis
MQVCYLINQLAPGGAPTLVLDLVRTIDSDAAEFTVCFIEGEDDLVPQFREAGARVVDFEAELKFDPRALAKLAHFFRQESFDVLHTHLPYSQTLGRLAAWAGGPPIVVSTQHNVPDNYHPVTRTLERLTRPLDDVTVACSEGVEQAFHGTSNLYDGTHNHGWCTIYNGIDAEGFSQQVADADGETVRSEHGIRSAPCLLNVARYVSAKAQDDLVAAMADLTDTVPDAHMLIVGWGERESELRTAVTEAGVEDSVTITGRVSSVHPYYEAADAFVSSSTFEGLPITHLEAMAANLPLVATDIPGVREVVVEGETGYLVPPNDPPRLASVMKRLLESGEGEEMGRRGRQRVEEVFSIERTAEAYLQLYCDLTSS